MSPAIENDIGFWLSVLGFVVGVGGICYAWYLAHRAERSKGLVLDVGPTVPLVSIVPEETGIKLLFSYEPEGSSPVPVQSLYLTFIRVGNLGREPIRAEDVAPNDPLLLTVANSPVIDVATVQTMRPVCRFQLDTAPLKIAGQGSNKSPHEANVAVTFAFLDYQDGALIRVLTETQKPKISLKGTVIGMPGGFTVKNYFRAAKASELLYKVFLSIITFSTFTLVPEIAGLFHYHLGGIVAGLVDAGITVLISLISLYVLVFRQIDHETRGRWPKKLSTPYWFSASYERVQREKHN